MELNIPVDLQLDRKLFVGLVKLRAEYKCEECGSDQYLTAHHIDGDRGNNCLANGRCLCRPCHNDVHNGKRDPYLLDIGCGDRPYEDGRGWIHLDERPLKHVDIRAKVEDIEMHVKEASVDEIRATHLLEHFSWRDTRKILESWVRLLKPGGTMYIEVPNMEWQARALVNGSHSHLEIVNLVFGDQDYPGNYHKAAFTPELLYSRLDEAGLVGCAVQDIGMVLIGIGRKDG